MDRLILLTGFAPFGGERVNPSWEVANRLDGRTIGAMAVKALKLPVNCNRATRQLIAAVERFRPAALLGLGQAGGRTSLSIEKIAINLADDRASHENDGGIAGKPVILDGPDAYFARIPLAQIVRALRSRNIPANMSLSAGIYVCNAVMYAGLHALRQRPRVPAGFIHLPYETSQAVRHQAAASMSLDMMVDGIAVALEVIARDTAGVPAASRARIKEAKPTLSRPRSAAMRSRQPRVAAPTPS